MVGSVTARWSVKENFKAEIEHLIDAIPPEDPNYTTGDATGLAQVIGIGTMLASSPARSISPASSTSPAKTVTAV